MDENEQCYLLESLYNNIIIYYIDSLVPTFRLAGKYMDYLTHRRIVIYYYVNPVMLFCHYNSTMLPMWPNNAGFKFVFCRIYVEHSLVKNSIYSRVSSIYL